MIRSQDLKIEKEDLGHIYKITSPNGKHYIGQAVCVLSSGRNYGYLKRWQGHIIEANNYRGFCRILDNAIRKYGHKTFKVELLEEILISQLNQREEFWIKELNTLSPNGYNLRTGSSKGSRESDETKEKKRQSMYGKNVGKILPKMERKREEDSDLPKYIRSYHDSSGKEGYRISHHPKLKDRSFVSKYLTMDEKLNLALNYLNSSNESDFKIAVQRLDGSGSGED
jgi:group I intron endonuclease